METIDRLPLFPLPKTVLFPDTLLPLFVFEPRYRALLEEALDGPGWVGIPTLLPGFEGQSDGTPPITKVFGVGRIEGYRRNQDGTSHLALVGVHIAELQGEWPLDFFRRGQVRLRPEPELTPEASSELRLDFASALQRRPAEAHETEVIDVLCELVRDPARSVEVGVHVAASALGGPTMSRQALLELPTVVERAQHLMHYWARLARTLGRGDP